MNIYLLRHGISVSNEKRIVCGASDYPLSTRGLAQAVAVCAELDKQTFSRIYCSPLQRAQQTIAHLIQQLVVTSVPALVELDTGDVSHITVAELYAHSPRYQYQGLSPDLKYPGGECLNDMMARVTGWFDQEKKNWADDENILIAGHEGTVCALLHSLLDLDISNYPTFAIGNCDYVHIHVALDGQTRYRFVNFDDPTLKVMQ
jgi:broad specificity phosphatase PhoE